MNTLFGRLIFPHTLVFVAVMALSIPVQADETAVRVAGRGWDFGNGTVTTYAEFTGEQTPSAMGVAFSAGALAGLPTAPSDQHHCFDRDSDGATDPMTECFATHEAVIPLPDALAVREDVPFKWVLFNWNPAGHIPHGVYDVPHFDIHFYIAPIADVFAIQDGPCGPEFVRCDQFELGRKMPPVNYLHPDFQNVDAVAPAMGNHLVDLTGPEFNGEQWKRNFIYGVYDGEITFYEEMVTRAHILSRPNECHPIKAAPAVARSGFYPTRTCIRHDDATGEYLVSMENFEFREASDPEPAVPTEAE